MLFLFFFFMNIFGGNDANTAIFNKEIANPDPNKTVGYCSNCNETNYTFTSQADIDNFLVQEPNCSHILGNLKILNGEDITNLNGLSNVQTIDGNLEIQNNSLLVDFSGLENLETIGEIFIIKNNSSLVHVTGVENLSHIGEELLVWANQGLEDLMGFSGLETVGFAIFISDNSSLNYFGFNSMIESPVVTTINNNDNLESLAGLETIEKWSSPFNIWNNDALTDISSLNEAEFTGNTITIANNPQLDDCNIASICNYLVGIDAGALHAVNNGSNCSTTATVQEICGIEFFPITHQEDETCYSVEPIEISAAAGNLNDFVEFYDSNGDIAFAINANGNELGLVEGDIFITNEIREEGLNYHYFNTRDVAIFPEFQPEEGGATLAILYTDQEAAFIEEIAGPNMNPQVLNTTVSCGNFPNGDMVVEHDYAPLFYGNEGDIFTTVEVDEFYNTFYVAHALSIPVNLVSFKAKDLDNGTQLDWVTASEINNEKFEIEHSADGIKFSRIGTVDGSGTTSEEKSYQFFHRAPVSGDNYYRLKQLDFDGGFEYSDIITINFESGDRLRVYPNPVADELFIENNQESDVKFYDSYGKLVISLTVENRFIDISFLTKGVYFVEIGSETQRIIKL